MIRRSGSSTERRHGCADSRRTRRRGPSCAACQATVDFGHYRVATAGGIINSLMAAELVCVECGRRADQEARGWQGHLVDLDDDGDDEVVFYCPLCATREFGTHRDR
jgi:hypothetical protein